MNFLQKLDFCYFVDSRHSLYDNFNVIKWMDKISSLWALYFKMELVQHQSTGFSNFLKNKVVWITPQF